MREPERDTIDHVRIVGDPPRLVCQLCRVVEPLGAPVSDAIDLIVAKFFAAHGHPEQAPLPRPER